MAESPSSTNSSNSSPDPTFAATRGRPTVQALLAELSDSDSDARPVTKKALENSSSTNKDGGLSGSESSDEDILVGGGRLANRLAGATAGKPVHGPDKDSSLGSRMPDLIQRTEDSIPSMNRSEQDFTSKQPTKRLLLKRKRSSEEEHRPVSARRIRSLPDSPQQSPTPTRSQETIQRNSPPPVSADQNEQLPGTGKSKFQMLVEKSRKEREAREAAELAKRAAIAAQARPASPQKRRPRGSSPADDSEENSDQSHTGAAKRLTNAARPTRKASKKALEEMSRETQRMTRNMQLAHEARTKKKFTKESFFASFNGTPLAPTEATELQEKAQPLLEPVSSSDAENDALHSTPPTSPLGSPPLNKKLEATANEESRAYAVEIQEEDEKDSFEDIFNSRRAERSKIDMLSVNKSTSKDQPRVHTRPSSMFPVHTVKHREGADSGSDSEIEVVHNRGDQRKFAAFENIPKRKARETSSHVALRSFANIGAERDVKSKMSRAHMGISLIQKARRQALQERQEKIEKLKAAGVIIQTAEEKEQDEEALENLVERARQEDEEIRKREKELAKKEGTYVKDTLDDEDSDDEDDDFRDEGHDEISSSNSDEDDEDEAEADDEHEDEDEQDDTKIHGLIDDAADDTSSEDDEEGVPAIGVSHAVNMTPMPVLNKIQRRSRIVLDDEDEDEDHLRQTAKSPALPTIRKTPQSILRSTRKVIPGLQHSDDLPIGLTQAFAATMAESQTQGDELIQEQDSMDLLRDLPSPQINMVPQLARLESMDMISESVPATQTQPLGLDFGLSQSQYIPESPAARHRVSASQVPFNLTQDAGYSFSPFAGNRFAETPRREPHSTEETILLPAGESSPSIQRKGRLERGRKSDGEEDDDSGCPSPTSAFQIMNKAAKRKIVDEFNKKKSNARQAVDEAAEESDDEYAGLGGASDEDSNDEENEEDRRMIDEDTQVGKGDEAKLAQLHANREREADEAAVNKMMKDITTGALRRKRGAGNDLDLSDEEDATNRKRVAKRREFAKMRRELLKDEAVGKIAEDKKKQAFLKSIEDRDGDDDEEDGSDFDTFDSIVHEDPQETTQQALSQPASVVSMQPSKPLQQSDESQLNRIRSNARRTNVAASRRPGTLAEIRESVSFLIEEPDSQAGIIDLGLSDSEEEPEAYVDLDRHLHQAEADEDALNDENADLGDFVIDDEDGWHEDHEPTFKKPDLPCKENDRAPFSERRTKAANVIDRLSLVRQASSSSASGLSNSSKMAFFSSRAGSRSLTNAPSLLRRATTNSSLGSMSGRENVSATGVVTSKTERGSAAQEKDFVRKGASTSRNAVNYQGRQSLKEEKMSARAGVMKKQQRKKKSGFLGSLFRGDTWD